MYRRGSHVLCHAKGGAHVYMWQQLDFATNINNFMRLEFLSSIISRWLPIEGRLIITKLSRGSSDSLQFSFQNFGGIYEIFVVFSTMHSGHIKASAGASPAIKVVSNFHILLFFFRNFVCSDQFFVVSGKQYHDTFHKQNLECFKQLKDNWSK